MQYQGSVIRSLKPQPVFATVRTAHAGGIDEILVSDSVTVIERVEGHNRAQLVAQDCKLLLQGKRGREATGQPGEDIRGIRPILMSLAQRSQFLRLRMGAGLVD